MLACGTCHMISLHRSPRFWAWGPRGSQAPSQKTSSRSLPLAPSRYRANGASSRHHGSEFRGHPAPGGRRAPHRRDPPRRHGRQPLAACAVPRSRQPWGPPAVSGRIRRRRAARSRQWGPSRAGTRHGRDCGLCEVELAVTSRKRQARERGYEDPGGVPARVPGWVCGACGGGEEEMF
jgi:hypothetical protein